MLFNIMFDVCVNIKDYPLSYRECASMAHSHVQETDVYQPWLTAARESAWGFVLLTMHKPSHSSTDMNKGILTVSYHSEWVSKLESSF